ncbi:DNA polymerase III subunits gamma and tau [Geofilum rubicundum JCM 15548]|uniref:DNA polymerase III subunits gamma and tau n=1 Tax=Geofilum rubicundum JCM 15548 TaxID=1236989 RepID=A0A0E9LU36_9BACT|nr:DNA polymerase III subunits gamma and tau [Geofilum rubicundum JCM 15548]
MLSPAAFNAFLKTLEEPPHHAIFILATTEKHKILPTILSRCQTFDFNRITVEVAVDYLKFVAGKEGIAFEEEALNVIATKADGAMRDALSIFDQIVAFSGKNVTYQQVIDNLNVLDYDYYFRLTEAFLKEDTTNALVIFNDILSHGFDGSHFLNGLSSHLRDLMMCRDAQTVNLLEVGASIRQRYMEQAKLCDTEFLYEALKIATNCDLNYRVARNKRLHVEFGIISLSRIFTEKKKYLS